MTKANKHYTDVKAKIAYDLGWDDALKGASLSELTDEIESRGFGISITRGKRTVDEFKRAVEKRGIYNWEITDCPLCKRSIGYSFSEERVWYGPECNCRNKGLRQSSYEEVADTYNLQQDEAVIKMMDKHWGFK